VSAKQRRHFNGFKGRSTFRDELSPKSPPDQGIARAQYNYAAALRDGTVFPMDLSCPSQFLQTAADQQLPDVENAFAVWLYNV
jgi:hypothetical protein